MGPSLVTNWTLNHIDSPIPRCTTEVRKAAHAANETILSNSDRMSTILPDRPLVAYRRTPNLQNLLIKTKSNTATSSPSQIPSTGCKLCSRSNCALCRHHLQPGARVTSSVTKNSYKILSNSHCNSENLIYVIAGLMMDHLNPSCSEQERVYP